MISSALLTLCSVYLMVVNGDNGHPTTQEVITCFQNIATAFELDPDKAISNEFAAILADELPISFNTLCDDIPYIASMIDVIGDIDNSTEVTRRMIRRRLADDDCLGNDTVFCNAIDAAPLFSTGDNYDSMLRDLSIPGHLNDVSDLLKEPLLSATPLRESYTDADAVALLLDDLFRADIVLAAADTACEIAQNCEDPLGITGCASTTTCAATVRVAQTATDAIRILLDKADGHDHVLMSTHLTALFEDRRRIISNQRYLDVIMEKRFNELTALNIKLFDLQTNWLNIKFEDIFFQLNTIDKLVRTPNGQRPGWNDQIGLDSLFVEPTDVSVPKSTDDLETNSAHSVSLNMNPISKKLDNDKVIDYNIYLLIIISILSVLLVLAMIIIVLLVACGHNRPKYYGIQQKMDDEL